MIDRQFLDLREYAFRAHRSWKVRSRLSDQILQGDWYTAWPDLTAEFTDPLVEDVYTEALYDKAASAASVTPQVEVAPTRGTRADRAEKVAQKRRRVFKTLLLTAVETQVQYAMDWLQHGAMFAMPWKDWRARSPYPYAFRLDPRHAYPISHDSSGRLTQVMFVRYRPLVELIHDYGVSNEALARLRVWFKARNRNDPKTVEEIWYVDEDQWGLAVVATEHPTPEMWRYSDPVNGSTGDVFGEWIIPLHSHRMEHCPVVEKRRLTADGEYRGALDPMIPNLKVAQNIMARLLQMVDMQTGVPVGLDNVENIDDFRPGGILTGTGEGDMRIIIPQFPVNFEAITHARSQVEAARNVGAYPQQRSGEPGASIASGKAAGAVMGAFNVQLAWNQRDLAVFYREMLRSLAEFDEKWCPGTKDVTGWDEGEFYSETYDPATFWRGDYRCEISFNRVGLEEHNFLTRLGLLKNMGVMSARTLGRKSGMIDNMLAEETEMDLEAIKQGFFQLVAAQAAQGNADPLFRYWSKIDGDGKTPRESLIETLKEMRLVNADGAIPPQPNEPRPDQAIRQERSLDAGGIPGQAEALPRLGNSLAGMLPPGVGNALESAR